MEVPCCGGIANAVKLLAELWKANSMADCNHLNRWSNYRKLEEYDDGKYVLLSM